MIHPSTLLRHYKQRDIQEAIVQEAEGKEVAVRYNDRFGKRPDALRYPQDVLELAQKGATSFHISEERWNNPLALSTELSRADLDNMRTGWDLVLDIDCHVLEYSTIAADLIVKALRHHGIENVGVKFSGNKGFHLAVPFEAFPSRIGANDTRLLFPDAPRRIAFYLKGLIKRPLGERILDREGDFGKILEKTGTKSEEVQAFAVDHLGTRIPYLDVEPFLDIDTVLIASRHLYRSCYSFNEKSGLVSIPIDPRHILDFSKESAVAPAAFQGDFLNRKASQSDARSLIISAFDHVPALPEEEGEKKEYELPEEAIPEPAFPPCMKLGFQGLQDGKKRFLFAASNFLSCCGWGHEQLDQFLHEWNKRNPQPLREVSLNGHLRYIKGKKPILPPNCRSFYEDLRICHPDNLCQKIRNPVSYARRKANVGGSERTNKGKGTSE